MSSRRSNFSSWPNICLPPSLNGRVAQHRSRSMQRKSRRQRSRAHIGRKRHGKAVRPDSCRGAATREPASVPATTSSSIPAGAQQPPMGRIPCPEGLGAHAGFAHMLRPPIRNPPRRSLDAQGRTPAGGQQGPRHFFRFFAPCAPRARTTRKLPSGDFYFHADFASSLAGTPALHATHAGARRATGGGPQSLRSKT